jgi:hypothetical protein
LFSRIHFFRQRWAIESSSSAITTPTIAVQANIGTNGTNIGVPTSIRISLCGRSRASVYIPQSSRRASAQQHSNGAAA